MSVQRATATTATLTTLWEQALHDVRAKRGGEALIATLCAGRDATALLEHLVRTASLWTYEDDELKGFAVVRGGVLEAAYVAKPWRRKGIATAIVTAILSSDEPPLDAYALPGDRATKSLYESLGWKARLLTMRGG